MPKKPQQHTLSIRVPEELRVYLERARDVISKIQGQSVSVSDVAKTLLERAKTDRVDDLAETPELMRHPTVTLVAIRTKWDQGRMLSRGEWVVLAYYIQQACESGGGDLGLPSRESLAQLLEAFLAVMKVVSGNSKASAHLGYYLKNLELEVYGLPRSEPQDLAEAVQANLAMLQDPSRPVNSAVFSRNLYYALTREEFQSLTALNDVLIPFLPALYRLAARGHWITEKEPVRYTSGPRDYGFVPVDIPPVVVGDFRLSTLTTNEGDLASALSLLRHDALYPLSPFPMIREFHVMLQQMRPGEQWTGREFFAYTDAYHRPNEVTRYYFRHRANGIIFGFTPEEWRQLGEMFERFFALPELKPVLEELSLQYGEL